jgi:hypothetical protein
MPVPQARRAAERVDERIPPCGGSLGEAARRDIIEAHQAAGQGLEGSPTRTRTAGTCGPSWRQADVADVAENVGTRLEDGHWDISVFFTDLPSRAEHNPVRIEAARERRVALRGERTVPEDASAREVCDEW